MHRINLEYNKVIAILKNYIISVNVKNVYKDNVFQWTL